MKNPIVITSLEEDFKKIGLIKESVAPQAEAEADDLEEKDTTANTAKRHKVITRGGKKVRTHRTSFAAKLKGKIRRRSGAFKAWAKKHARKMKRFAKKIARRAMKAVRLGTRKESVETRFDLHEALKSHANLAIIAERMSEDFGAVAEVCEAEGLGEAEIFGFMAEYFAETAEQVGALATEMNESADTLDTRAVQESFTETMEIVLDGVDLYEAMSAEDEDEDEDEDEESEDDAEAEDDEGNE